LGLALAAWLAAGVAIGLAGRIGLGRVSPVESLRRAVGLPRAAWGMTAAHFGAAVLVAGLTGASAWQSEAIQVMAPGATVELAGYAFTFEGESEVAGPNYTARRGTFAVTRAGREVARLVAEKRFFPSQGTWTTEAAIHTTWSADLYAVIGDPADGGAWSTRIYHNPLVPWMWIGAVIMVIGGAVSLTDRRHRVGAPARRRLAAAPGD
ncbi:MAG: cytochrome c-type biogenesis CcmF C-terminal domain-containing protein, partial [Alphaproteobacteria bacterium]